MSQESGPPTLKRFLVGKPIPSHLAHHERLSRVTGLAVLSSDALSSVAYATDFILLTLIVAGAQAVEYALPISFVIAALLGIVAFSYRQTIHAYPTGGGAYIVAKEDIRDMAGLVAGASLLVDYTLTVSVSISAGVLAVTSAAPQLDEDRVEMCLVFLTILTVGNLRGIRESGRIFAVPTYFFVFGMFALIAAGLYRYSTGTLAPLDSPLPANTGSMPLTTFLLLTAFANGCTAMTGVEAVSNGREPAWRTSAFINGFSAFLTAAVLVIVAFTKTLEGAWIVLLLIPAIVAVFKATRRHYDHVASQLTLRGYAPQPRVHNTVLVPLCGIQRPVVEALRYAETLSNDVRGVYVDLDPEATEQVRRDWLTWGGNVMLVVLPSPYRSLLEPPLEYIEQVENERSNDYVTVILPEFVPARWWQHLLHNQRALLITGALLFRPNTVVTSVPFHLAR